MNISAFTKKTCHSWLCKSFFKNIEICCCFPEGFNVNYEVTVKKKTETGLKAIYTDGIFQIEAGGVLVPRDLIWVFVKYEGIGEGYMEHSANNGVSIYVDGAKCEQTADGYVVQNGTTSASQILIKYGSYELLLDNSLEMVEV